MIVKELDPFTAGNDKFMAAGRAAEEQLAFYLKRAFERDPKTLVFNGLRFEREGDAAQIDHLLMHPWGIIIVESKSVVGEVRVNPHLEWSRRFNNGPWNGMASPILQGKRQGDFLRRLMEDNAPRLLTKLLGFQKHFGSLAIDVIVAISDRGVITRPKKPELPEICKADQVPERAKERMQYLAKVNSPLGIFSLDLKNMGLDLNREATQRITGFFLEQHRPLEWPPQKTRAQSTPPPVPNAPASPVPPSPAPAYPYAPPPSPYPPAPAPAPPIHAHPAPPHAPAPAPPSPAPAPQAMAVAPPPAPAEAGPVPRCKSCAVPGQGHILYGKYGYYFKCSLCSTNTNVNEPCPACRQRTRLRKDGAYFTLECGACGLAVPYHTNRS